MRIRLLLSLVLSVAALPAAPATRHVLLVTLDGLRWQEVFRGADPDYVTTDTGGVPEAAVARIRNGIAPDIRERRRALMPFLWNEVAVRGQVFGNRDRGAPMHVGNAEWVSYPGYSELLCGVVDPLITSNAPVPNRNVSVLEWLNGRPAWAPAPRGSCFPPS